MLTPEVSVVWWCVILWCSSEILILETVYWYNLVSSDAWSMSLLSLWCQNLWDLEKQTFRWVCLGHNSPGTSVGITDISHCNCVLPGMNIFPVCCMLKVTNDGPDDDWWILLKNKKCFTFVKMKTPGPEFYQNPGLWTV